MQDRLTWISLKRMASILSRRSIRGLAAATPHAYACGADHMALIRNNLMGIENPVQIGGYAVDKVMMKYNEIMLTTVYKEEASGGC